MEFGNGENDEYYIYLNYRLKDSHYYNNEYEYTIYADTNGRSKVYKKDLSADDYKKIKIIKDNKDDFT